MPGDTNYELGDKGAAAKLRNADNAAGGGAPQKGLHVIGEDGELVVGGAEAGEPGSKEAVTKAEGTSEAPAAKDPMVSFFKLFSFADTHDYLLMFFGTIGAIVHGAALPIFFLFFGRLMNGLGGITEQPTHTVNKYSTGYLYLGLASLFSSWLEVSFWMQTGDRQSAKLRTKYLEALLRQDVAYFDTEANTGTFVTSIASDPLMVQDAISEKVGNFIHFMGTFVTGFAVGFYNQWRIALVTIAVVPLIAMAGGFYAWTLTTATTRASESYAAAGNVAEQAIAQVRTVYSSVGESKFSSDYSAALHKTMNFGSRAGLAKGIGQGFTYSVLFASWALLLWYGGILVRAGTVDGGKALATIFAVFIGGISLGQAMPNITAFANGRVAAFRIFKVINRPATINRPDKSAEKLESVEGHLELRNVDFSYPARPDVPIFQNFSLTISTGKTVAIVGTSGSGKSTVVSLIERFYDPISGRILLDGHDLKTLDLKWLRDQIGLVNQEPALFATTIKANILYGKDNATDEEIVEAAKASNAHSFIEQLPLRYETQVGERGIQLSGGQKQRVAIARAMLKNPTVLLLDEATSALDAGSEQVVQEALDRLMVGRTTVVVAHRLSTIRNADSIAVVQQGRIVEMGPHRDLISRPDGAYSALVRLQELAATQEGSTRHSSSNFKASPSLRLSRGAGSSGSPYPRDSKSLSLKRDASTKLDGAAAEGDEDQDAEKGVVTKKQKGSITRLVMMSRPDWLYGLGGLVGSILVGFFNPAFAWIISEVISAYYSKNFSYMRRQITLYGLLFVALGVLSPLVYILQHYSLGVVNEKLVRRVREQMFGNILRNELGWFDKDENTSSQLLARLSSDATHVRAAIGDRVSVLVQNSTLLFVAMISSLILQWKLALVMLSTFPLLVGSAIGENLFMKGFSGDLGKAYSRATQIAGEAAANIRTVAAFNAEDKVQALFTAELQGPATKSFWRGQVAGFGFGLSQLLMYGSYGLGLWYSGQLVKRGEAGFSSVLRVFMILIVTAFAVAETLALTPDLVKGGQAVSSVFEVLDRKTAIDPEDPKSEMLNKIAGEIELRGVSFAYPSRPDVIIFKDLNLRVRAGRSLALVGASGSGKSSVIALLERFYDPLAGQVLIDGKDLKRYNLKSIRHHIALVMQEPALFNTTIQENILFGSGGASEAEVIEAAKAANAHNFVCSLPNGYQTEVGERGIQLSGGQKQRIAIARAVLKDPAILLLDEATSALDAESEKIVQEALDRLMKGRTTVMIAHRLSTIRGADSIAVVQDGTILEEGSHADLVNRGGGYARLINLQNRVNESESAPLVID